MKPRVQGINRSLNKDVATYSSLLLNNCKLTMYVEVLRKIQEFTTNFKGKNKTHTLPPPKKTPQQQCTLLKFIKCYTQGPPFISDLVSATEASFLKGRHSSFFLKEVQHNTLTEQFVKIWKPTNFYLQSCKT